MTIQSRIRLLALILTIVALTPGVGFAQAAAATSAPAAAPSKIAFVNLQEAVVSCNEGKQQAAALEQRFKAKQTALKAQDDELKKLKDDFQVVSAKLNDSERNARERAIQEKQKAFERDYSDYQSETQEAQQDAINSIVKKMLPVMEKYVIANGYSAVFDVSNPQTPILWARKDGFITQQLIDAYNAQSGTAPPAPAPTPKTGGATAPPKQ